MRRWLAYLLIWSLGTAATVGTSWLGLRSVLEASAPQRSNPLSAAELRRATPLPEPAQAGPATSGSSGSEVSGTASIGAGASAGTTGTSAPAASATTAPSSATVSSATIAVPYLLPGTTTPDPAWQPIAMLGGNTAFRRTFHVRGGDLTFWSSKFDAYLMDADLRLGWVMVFPRYDDVRTVTVSLLSGGRISRVMVTWRDGPYAEVTEG